MIAWPLLAVMFSATLPFYVMGYIVLKRSRAHTLIFAFVGSCICIFFIPWIASRVNETGVYGSMFEEFLIWAVANFALLLWFRIANPDLK